MARVFYLMGPSGSGKDSLINGLRARFGGQSPILFAHRYITRCWRSGGENHFELTEEEFDQRLKCGLFALHWEANDCRYGIGREVENWLDSGFSVLVNGSRGHLQEAQALFGEALVPVLVSVDSEQLRQRLLLRGREDLAQIEQRLERNRRFESALEGQAQVLDNSGDIEQAIESFAELLYQYSGATTHV
ncbi:ribose 1,5-bisphosphokinase [Marinobacterium sediminicola]|uniref:Ribose 1,5-bisphosphate phosphokinase PhnN n=1 Tax=Marinobacterium sediminicola TaxID=518898 RepID=A0ABY1RYU5_9GAMM|nr:ribose 1,5-bisphosphokinase [Marinobacterium sediminicola]ULG70835.1 ribose 1,5-bisphosphokinase [Marinobacterium sediminicola]SMR73383.1 ribose 1,5-bisphosphokinase [Marinobacterium sediminicola]